MIKKISISVLSAAIVIIGIVAFNRFHYWERSVAIFKINNQQSFGRGFGGERNEFGRNFGGERFEGQGNRMGRPNFQNIPDSIRQRSFAGRRFPAQSDSLRTGRFGSFNGNRQAFGDQGFDRNRMRGGGFRRGNDVQLRNVLWFMAVFMAYTTITFYIDKTMKYYTKRRKSKNLLKI